MQEMIGLVLNIFLQMNELESLDFQLNQIARLLVVYPALHAMVTHFQKVRLLLNQDVSSSLVSHAKKHDITHLSSLQVLWEKKEQLLVAQKRRVYIQQQPTGAMPNPISPHPLTSPPPMPMHQHPMQPPMPQHHMPPGLPPSHMAQMSPHQVQTQMSPQQSLVAQMTPPQPQVPVESHVKSI